MLREEPALVVVALDHQMDPAASAKVPLHRRHEPVEKAGGASVVDLVDRVESEAVEVESFEPRECVLDKVALNELARSAGEVDRGAPRSLKAVGEELRGGRIEI